MDENVLFNPSSQDNQATDPATGDPTAQTPGEQTPGDPAAVPSDDPNAVQDGADESTGEIATDGTEAGFEPPPPEGFFNGGLIKKLLIGVGILAVLIVIIIVVINLNSTQQSKIVTLEWWGLWEDQNTMEPLISDFEKTHPNIKVTYEQKDPKQYAEQLLTRIKNGTGPDIFRYHNSWLPMLGDDVAPMTSNVISAGDFKKAYYPVMQQDLTYNGAIYGIPMEADTLELFTNPKLFDAAAEQVPTTWDQFNDAAKNLTVKSPDTGEIKTSGAALGTYDNIMHAPDIISLLLVQQGVVLLNLPNYPKNEVSALEYYGSFAHGDSSVWNNNLDNSLLAFSKGNLAMYFGYSWDVFAIQQLNSNLQFKISPVPSNQGVKTTIASYWVEGVSSKSTHPKEAMEFMHYLAQKDTAEKFYTQTAKVRKFGEPYARKDLQSSLSDNPLVYPFVQGLDNASSTYFASDTNDGDTGVNTLMNNYLQTAINALTDDPNSAQGVIDDLNNGVTQVFQKYGSSSQ